MYFLRGCLNEGYKKNLQLLLGNSMLQLHLSLTTAAVQTFKQIDAANTPPRPILYKEWQVDLN